MLGDECHCGLDIDINALVTLGPNPMCKLKNAGNDDLVMGFTQKSTFLWFEHGCSGHRLGSEMNGFGMDVLVTMKQKKNI